MLQTKISILSTRPVDENLVTEAATKGFFVDIKPFIRTEPIQSIEVLQEIELALLQSAMVVFTSMNAVKAVAEELKGQKPDWLIYCIGNTTRELTEKYFGKDLIAGTADNAKDLAGIIINKPGADKVIFFCGDQHRNELPDALRENNIDINEIVVYQTTAIPHKIDKNYNGILFFSPSAVQSFFQKNKLNHQTILFAIGNTTANEIKKYLRASPVQASAGKAGSTNKIVVSDEPGKKTLLEKAITFFQTHPIHH